VWTEPCCVRRRTGFFKIPDYRPVKSLVHQDSETSKASYTSTGPNITASDFTGIICLGFGSQPASSVIGPPERWLQGQPPQSTPWTSPPVARFVCHLRELFAREERGTELEDNVGNLRKPPSVGLIGLVTVETARRARTEDVTRPWLKGSEPSPAECEEVLGCTSVVSPASTTIQVPTLREEVKIPC
jgi:hypothetical protein